MDSIIEQLAQVLAARQTASPDTSYTASLFAAGLPKIEKKLQEELAELIEAARELESSDAADSNREALVHEAADLWFHSMVLLTHYGASPTMVLDELERRFGTSGLEEKRSRKS